MPTTLESSADPQLGANKAIVRSFIDAWNTRDFDRFDVLMGKDAVLRIGGAVVSCDPQATRSIAEAWEVYDEAGMWRQLGVPPPGDGR